MKSSVTGVCALCLNTRELRKSHFLPKALYRLIRADRHRNPHPVRLSTAGRLQTAFQATHHLLCAGCESRFDRNGENWVMAHCYRGKGVFRLRTILEAGMPHAINGNCHFFSAHEAGIDIEKLAYFCVSVFWRASIRDWDIEGQTFEAISLGKRYQEEIRRYLLAEASFPKTLAVGIMLSSLKTPALTFGFPDTVRIDSHHCHRLHIPGIDFSMTVGRDLDEGVTHHCVVRSSLHPILISDEGDARIQREVMRVMGKPTPPQGYEYPLVEGFESPQTKKK